MADEVGTIINAEVEGIKIVAKGTEEAIKALLKLLSVLFGKEAAERRRANAAAKLSEEELKALTDKTKIEEKLKNNPLSATMSDLQLTSKEGLSVLHFPKQYSKPGSAIVSICQDKVINLPDKIKNDPVIESRIQRTFKWLEKNPDEAKKLNKDDFTMSKLDYLRTKSGLPLVKSSIDDNPNDDFDCMTTRSQDLAMWADAEKSALKEYKTSKEEQAIQYEQLAKEEDGLSEKEQERDQKKKHKKNADNAREAKKECENDIKAASDFEKSGPVSLEEFAQKESVQKSIEDVTSEKIRTGQHWEETPENAFKPVYSEDKVPESGKRYYAGKNGSYAVREYTVEPPRVVTVLNDDGTEDEKIEPARVSSSYNVYDKSGKVIGLYDERQCTPKQWSEQALPALMENLGLAGATAIMVGETKDAIAPVDVERAKKPLSEDAKEFNKAATKEAEKTENFNRAAVHENIRNVGGDEKTLLFEAELKDGSKAAIAVPNDTKHIARGEDGQFNVTLNKNESYAVYKAGEAGFKNTGKTVSHDTVARLGNKEIRTASKTTTISKAPVRK